MRKHLILLPIALVTLTSCGTATRLRELVDQSSMSIDANSQAIQRSTEAVRRNKQLIQEANQAVEENRRNLEKLSAS